MTIVKFDIELSEDICDHYERFAKDAGTDVESYLSNVVSQKFSALVAEMETDHGL